MQVLKCWCAEGITLTTNAVIARSSVTVSKRHLIVKVYVTGVDNIVGSSMRAFFNSC